ncbi:MAG: relaxase/mobilization nuclease domain-containing protein, partial [Lachnospiraceae bacterium]|nr:relaxase/mobilization nuclease domain-containing protein [Lachnospiraceae bacterium]
IHAIKTTVHKSIAYICNPDKTEGELLISSFACDAKFARYQFQDALSKTRNYSDDNKAYHLIQSFAPGEVSPEEAHRIGIELAERLLKGDYSYVIATHTDRQHPHNHIIFCAADNVEHKKFNSRRKTIYQIKQFSDEICKEHGLSVIEQSGRKGKSYYEWKADKGGRSWKTQLKKDIDEVVKIANTYEEFILLIKDRGYAIKGETLGEKSLKYISFRAPEQQRFVRGSLRSLGEKYTKVAIKRRIEEKSLSKGTEPKRIKPHQQNILKRTDSNRALIDTSQEKFRNSASLNHWANLKNLQTAARSYSEAESLSALKEKITIRKNETNEIRTELIAMERELAELKELQYFLTQYKDNLPFRLKYKKSKDPDRYMRMHETQLLLFDSAKHKLQKMGITPKMSELEQINRDIAALKEKHSALQKRYHSSSNEVRDLEQKLKNIEQYLGYDKDAVNEKPDRKPKRSDTLE